MTVRDYAKKNFFEIVGKLTHKTVITTKYDVKKDDFLESKTSFYIDEAGNEFHKLKGQWCIITSDGDVI